MILTAQEKRALWQGYWRKTPLIRTEVTFRSERLQEARQFYGLTQQDMAQGMAVHRAMITFWENGYSQPDRTSLFYLCKTLHVSADWLMGLSDRGGPSEEDLQMLEIGDLS